MDKYFIELAEKNMQRTDRNFYSYLLHADDGFEYERPENKPQLGRKALEEIEEGKNIHCKHPSKEETLSSWSDAKKEYVKSEMDENDGFYIDCKPGPLRSEPGLVGIWQQEKNGGWRQIGLQLDYSLLHIYKSAADKSRCYVGQNYKEYGVKESWRIQSDTMRCLHWTMKHPSPRNYRKKVFPVTTNHSPGTHRYMVIYEGYGIGTSRTCRCFLWNGKPFKSAYYTPEETAYLVESRATFYDLLDCDIIYADDETRALLNMPVADYMFDKQHQEYPPCINVHNVDMPSPEQLFRAFGERCFEVMSYPSVPEFHPFNKVSPVIGTLLDDESRCPYVDPEEIFPHLLDDFLIMFRIAKEYGSKKDEYIRWEEKGGLDRAVAIYAKLKKWVNLCGFSGKYYGYTHYGWVLSFFDKENIINCYTESFDRYKDGDVEDYAHRAMLTFMAARDGLLGDTDEFCLRSSDIIFQVINRPMLDEKNSGIDIARIIKKYVLTKRGENKSKIKPALNKQLNTRKINLDLFTEIDRSQLKTALEIMNMTIDEFSTITVDELQVKCHQAMANVNQDASNKTEQIGDIRIAYYELKRLREKYMQ